MQGAARGLCSRGTITPEHWDSAVSCSRTMVLKAALLLSLLAACPGGRGGSGGSGAAWAAAPAPLPPAAPPAKPAQSGLWEHLSQLTGDKDSLEHGQSKLRRDIA